MCADSGTTLDAQARYAAGIKEILRRLFEGEKLNPTDVIVEVCDSAMQCTSVSRVSCSDTVSICSLSQRSAIVQGGKLAAQYDVTSKDARSLDFSKPEWEKNLSS